MKPPHYLPLLLLLATVSWLPTVVSVSGAKDYPQLSMYQLLIDPAKINASDWDAFNVSEPVSNSTNGWPYSRTFIRPNSYRPSHVIPYGCAWYSVLSDSRTSCSASQCPGDRGIEVFRGLTLQKTLYYKRGKEEITKKCRRQRGVPVPATFCCNSTVFRQNFTMGDYTPHAFAADCHWMGPSPNCFPQGASCPKIKWRNEVARASASWNQTTTKNSKKTKIDTRAFGKQCNDGNRILCCRDSAFWIHEKVEAYLHTDLNYLFPALIGKKNKLGMRRVKLIFAPGATRRSTLPTIPTTTIATTTTTSTTTTTPEPEHHVPEDENVHEDEDVSKAVDETGQIPEGQVPEGEVPAGDTSGNVEMGEEATQDEHPEEPAQ